MGLTINVSYDSSVTSLAGTNATLYSEYTTAVQAAVNFFQTNIANNITLNINFGWGEAGGSPIGAGAAGQSSSVFNTFTYADLLAGLQSSLTHSAVQTTALATLPLTDPTGGASFKINFAQQLALGITSGGATSSTNDGGVGLDATGTNWTWVGGTYSADSVDAVAVFEHEISEVMGRIATGGASGQYRELDLFRYTAANGLDSNAIGAAAGVRDEPFVGGYNANAPSYFSYNGTTNTLLFETPDDVAAGSDVADWAPSAGFDAFGDGPSGAPSPVSATDLQELNVLGYTLACFLPGTRIATPRGEVQVQELKVGDLVLTQRGESKPITWIGQGAALATRGRRTAATPVIVRKGAMGDNCPNRDLHITKGHALYVDDVLIPAEFLVNHRSIQWDDRAQEVTVYHIELERHDVLLANGAPAESYRDDGNRWLFRNASTGWDQPAKPPCAPVLTGGPIVDAIWSRLLALAGPRPGLPLTEDADLHLLVDGVRVDGEPLAGGGLTFRLPPHARGVRIVSRSGVPEELGLSRDPRVLGVAIRQIVAWRGRFPTVTEADDPRLHDGFHGYEADNGFRWTNGDAELPASVFEGAGALDLYLRGDTLYPLVEAA